MRIWPVAWLIPAMLQLPICCVDLNANLVDRQVHEIREVEATLKRLAELNFGDCIECGGEIGFERLMAYPTAQRCVRCQELREKTYSHENKPTLFKPPVNKCHCGAGALSSTSTAPLPPSSGLAWQKASTSLRWESQLPTLAFKTGS